MVNGEDPVIMLQPMVRQGGKMFVAGEFNLEAGDFIRLQVGPEGPTKVWMRYCYFGAYLI